MYLENGRSTHLDWCDVAPLVYKIHDDSLDPYMLRWPRLAWLALEEDGLVGAGAEVDHLDSAIRAVSLAHFHLEFLSELRLSYLDIEYDAWLEGIVTEQEISFVLDRKYETDGGDRARNWQGISDAFLAIYPYHMKQIFHALFIYFGSVQRMFDSLIETATCPDDSPLRLRQVGAAHDFMIGAVEVYGNEQMSREW